MVSTGSPGMRRRIAKVTAITAKATGTADRTRLAMKGRNDTRPP
jgi:hypothetical protein